MRPRKRQMGPTGAQETLKNSQGRPQIPPKTLPKGEKRDRCTSFWCLGRSQNDKKSLKIQKQDKEHDKIRKSSDFVDRVNEFEGCGRCKKRRKSQNSDEIWVKWGTWRRKEGQKVAGRRFGGVLGWKKGAEGRPQSVLQVFAKCPPRRPAECAGALEPLDSS